MTHAVAHRHLWLHIVAVHVLCCSCNVGDTSIVMIQHLLQLLLALHLLKIGRQALISLDKPLRNSISSRGDGTSMTFQTLYNTGNEMCLVAAQAPTASCAAVSKGHCLFATAAGQAGVLTAASIGCCHLAVLKLLFLEGALCRFSLLVQEYHNFGAMQQMHGKCEGYLQKKIWHMLHTKNKRDLLLADQHKRIKLETADHGKTEMFAAM